MSTSLARRERSFTGAGQARRRIWAGCQSAKQLYVLRVKLYVKEQHNVREANFPGDYMEAK
jgi:hypothetical protein